MTTNRERAKELWSGTPSVSEIERALDDAEKRGYLHGFKIAEIQCGEQIVEALAEEPKKLIEAYKRGAEEMRERAASMIREWFRMTDTGVLNMHAIKMANGIRSLPTEEKK